jgi:hypothetical protein
MSTFCSVSANMRRRAELSGPRVVSSSLTYQSHLVVYGYDAKNVHHYFHGK